jgi:flagellin
MLSIQTNTDSLIAQQNLSVNSQFQSNTIQQLTSGYRINSSSDDAAGLAVANQYRDQIAELNQGVLNANDGTSQLQIMDGGLDNISQMLDRLQTLATESASSTFTGNRSTLNNEYQNVLGEIDRQADNIGLGATNSVNATNLGVYIGGGQDANTNSTVNVDLTNSGVGTAALGLSNTSVLTTGAVQVSTAVAKAVVAGDAATFQVYTTSGQHTITINGQPGDTLTSQMGDLNTQLSNLGISAAINGTGNLTFTSSNAFSVSAIATGGGGASNLVNITTPDTSSNTGLNYYTFTGQAGGGSHVEVTVGGTTAIATLTAPAAPTQTDVDSINAALQAQGITSVAAVLDQTAANTISFQGSTSFSVSDDHAVANTYTLDGNSTAPLTTAAGNPQTAINAIAAALQSLGQTQGKIGAGENTLNYAINLAQSQITNFSSAESQIRDANVAQEAANLTKAQVLQQTSIAAMAQANAEPQALLKLFQ